MRNPAGDTSSALTLQAQLSDACRVPTTEVFIGKLNWFSYAVNEMVTLVVPGGIADGAVVGLYYQWTIDAAGKRKGNVCVNSHFREVSSSDGKTKATFGDGYYTYDITVASGSKTLTINMRNPSGNSVAFDVQQTDWRQLHQKRVRRDPLYHISRSPLTVYLSPSFAGAHRPLRDGHRQRHLPRPLHAREELGFRSR